LLTSIGPQRRRTGMRVLFLGGAGAMAASMARYLRDEDAMETVTIADRNEAAAQKRVSESGPKFSAAVVDLEDAAGLRAVIKGHDIVLNYAGPFYRFEGPCAKAAIESGVNYISIADDFDAYLAVAELEDMAREANVKVMTGFGNSPGLTQILAKLASMAVATPKRIAVNWAAGANEEVGRSNILHLMHLMSGKTLQWRNGAEAYVPCGGGKKTVEFPLPIGRIPTWYTGHAESVTLPRWIPGLDFVSVHGGCVPAFDFQLVAFLSKLGLTKTHKRRTRLFSLLEPLLPLFQSPKAPDVSVGRVEVWGKDENNAEKYVYYTYSGHIADITSLPCLLAMTMWKSGAFNELPGGVYPPERLIVDPAAFVAALRARGVTVYEGK
jgi:saccharopine dehydrogenase-like NADP-dependent oxidoreductase